MQTDGLFKILTILNISQNQSQKAGERAFSIYCTRHLLGCVGRAARPGPAPALYTLLSRFLVFITLRVVSQFLYTTGKFEQKSVSRFLFLDF